MARSSTTVGKGNQLAVKHGRYASARLAHQSAVLEEAKRRMQAGELAPMLESITKALQITEQMLDDVYGWLSAHGGPLTPTGKVKQAATLADRLLVHYASQAATLYRLMASASPDLQALTQEQAQQFLGERYRDDHPDSTTIPTPAELPSAVQSGGQ